MKNRILHTPEGVRDIYNGECSTFLALKGTLRHCINLYGFHDIKTPAIEFFDVFNEERGTVASKDMFKFFDREGHTLVLRPDMTPPIARCVAKYYKNETLPLRLCYSGNTFINNSGYQGKLKEITQLGAELVNDSSVYADAEMIALTVECLRSAGLKEFQVEIGHADFFQGLIEDVELDEEELEQLKLLIENKNMFAVAEMLSDKNMDVQLKEILLKLPELFGTIGTLTGIKSMLKNERAFKAIERLEDLYSLLKIYGLEEHITFDLGMLSTYNYYTGIIFRAYTYGTGDAVATGGRYDSLIGQFGMDAPAIGVAVVLDQLMLALTRQKLIEKPDNTNTLIVYKSAQAEEAIKLAKQFRGEDMNVELLCAEEFLEPEEYAAYADRSGIGGILCIRDEKEILVINAADGSTNIQKLSV